MPVPIDTCCALVLVIEIVAVNASWGSVIKSPRISTGIFTLVVPAKIVTTVAAWAV